MLLESMNKISIWQYQNLQDKMWNIDLIQQYFCCPWFKSSSIYWIFVKNVNSRFSGSEFLGHDPAISGLESPLDILVCANLCGPLLWDVRSASERISFFFTPVSQCHFTSLIFFQNPRALYILLNLFESWFPIFL
jgi:hypothetical protein